VERLDAEPPIDILHFDGHGVFDPQGGLPERLASRTITLSQALAGALLKDTAGKPATDSPPNTGYLLFEKPDGSVDLVPAEKLGLNLHRRRVPLVILSACQGAAHGEGEEPLGSVAARLTAAGIPAVLAMTHSVLVATTAALFGEFYDGLARHRSIGEALDAARLHLHNNPEKYQVQRGPERVALRLYDWFVPALYQGGADLPLLRAAEDRQPGAGPSPLRSNLRPRPESGFFGRRRALWDIERWFADQTRRITITGFGGQGKTALAEEAGRWLMRIGLFRAAVVVDYSRVQSVDAVAVAVSQIGGVLEESLIDAKAALEALRQTPTLVILDNLEALAVEPLRELLDVATGWSEAGGSRVLLTTRTPDCGHPHYQIEGTRIHRRLMLDGLSSREAPDDALEWFAELVKLPPPPEIGLPKRDALIELFDKVRFHPLSIQVLAQQLKTRRPAELGGRLEALLAAGALPGATDTPPELLASLTLSLDRLDESARALLPRLGVFQGGAFEANLLAITGLGEGQDGEPSGVWPALRRPLESAALLQVESVPGIAPPFLRFHPTLAPMLWGQISPAEQARLTAAHRERYHQVANYLYQTDTKKPHEARAIARRELPNLLHAVDNAFATQDPGAVDFANSVTKFLGHFGFKREAERLSALSQSAAGEEGSGTWYMAQSNRGERLLAAGRANEALPIFQTILEQLGDTPSFERTTTIARLGRCFAAAGRPDIAAERYREGIAVAEKLAASDEVNQLTGFLHTDLADVLMRTGQYAEARKEYEAGIEIAQTLGDVRAQGISLGQIGTLAMLEGKLGEALNRHLAALAFFQKLGEPDHEAKAWHQLGRVFVEAGQWDKAERHYRESARIKEALGHLAGAARTWNELAIVSAESGKPNAAEHWFRKAIEVGRRLGDQPGLSGRLLNLANLLKAQPARLAEARRLAEEALEMKKTLDPAAAEIWKTYAILADIAEQEQEANLATDFHGQVALRSEASEHRRLALEHEHRFASTRHAREPHLPLIAATLMAAQDPTASELVDAALAHYTDASWNELVAAIRRIVAGERDEDALQTGQFGDSPMIIATILAALADPSVLEDLLPPAPPTA
jgi:tetratricopeptide (TPR) repeat protein